MSKTFGKLFGSPGKSSSVSTSASGYAALPEFGQKAWENLISTTQGLAGNTANFAPAPITAPQQQALGLISKEYAPITEGQFREGISKFSNPFVDDVLGGVERDLRKQGQGMFSDLSSAATDAGAFGGTRQAVAQGEIGRNLLEVLGDTSGTLRANAYETAADRVLNEFNKTYENQQSQGVNLFNLGEILRQIETGTQQAAVTGQEWFADILRGLNSSTGTGTSTATSSSAGIIPSIMNAFK